MEDGVRLHLILHFLSPVYSTSNVWFKTKLSNKYTVGSKITKRNFPGGNFLSFLKWLCIVLPSFLSGCTLVVVLCTWLYAGSTYVNILYIHCLAFLSTLPGWYEHPGGSDVTMVWASESEKISNTHWDCKPLKEGQAESKGTQQLTLSLLERLMS